MDMTADEQATPVTERDETVYTSVSNPRRIRL